MSLTWVTYLLRCRGGSLYCGATPNLTRRLIAHAAGKGSKYVRSRLPFELAWQSPPTDKRSALRLEAVIKGWSHRDKLDLVKGRMNLEEVDSRTFAGIGGIHQASEG